MANALPDPVPEAIKEERRARFMAVQSAISARRLSAKVGTIQTVLIDTIDGKNAIGRSTADAPEIDGMVTVEGGGGLRAGTFTRVAITAASEHDLVGRIDAA